jgi:hypothetical protein
VDPVEFLTLNNVTSPVAILRSSVSPISNVPCSLLQDTSPGFNSGSAIAVLKLIESNWPLPDVINVSISLPLSYIISTPEVACI